MAFNGPPNFAAITEAYEKITEGSNTLVAEIPRLNNIEPIQAGQQIQQTLAQIQQTLTQMQQALTQIQQTQQQTLDRLSTLEFRTYNIEIRAKNTRHQIHPLRDIRTGELIPNCPASSTEINRLPSAIASAILHALQIPINAAATVAQKRVAVRLALLNN